MRLIQRYFDISKNKNNTKEPRTYCGTPLETALHKNTSNLTISIHTFKVSVGIMREQNQM